MTQNAINTSKRLVQFLSTASGNAIICTTQIPVDDTIPQVGEGNEILSLSITPKSASSTLVITFSCNGRADGVLAASDSVALFQDGGANALTAVRHRDIRLLPFRYVMASGTTAATTFSVRGGQASAAGGLWITSADGVNRIMGGVGYTNLTIEEYL